MALTSLQLFKNLSDETRLGIVLLLREMGELCVCDLCCALEQSQPKISRHLAMLRESGLLLDSKRGKWVHYRFRICHRGQLRLLSRPGVASRTKFRRWLVSWHRPIASAVARLFVAKNFALIYSKKHMY